MKQSLPTVNPRIIWDWGVCETYRDAEFLRNLMKGKEEVDAVDVLALDIRPVDKLWALLRKELLPAEVLDAFTSRILAMEDVPADLQIDAARGRINGDIRKESVREALRKRAHADHRWDVCRHVAAAVKYSGVRNWAQEYDRQLAILVEELERWISNQDSNESGKGRN